MAPNLNALLKGLAEWAESRVLITSEQASSFKLTKFPLISALRLATFLAQRLGMTDAELQQVLKTASDPEVYELTLGRIVTPHDGPLTTLPVRQLIQHVEELETIPEWFLLVWAEIINRHANQQPLTEFQLNALQVILGDV